MLAPLRIRGSLAAQPARRRDAGGSRGESAVPRAGGSGFLPAALIVLAALALTGPAPPAGAQSVIDTIANVPSPNHRTLNQATNRLYVTNAGTTTVTVVNTTNDAAHTIDLGAGNSPVGIALDSTANLLYLTLTNGTLAVIDGATDAVVGTGFLCCPALTNPSGIALDTSQDILYVADTAVNQLVVIHAAAMRPGTNDGVIGRVTLGTAPSDVVFHSTNNQVYVSNNGSTTVSVVNRQVGTGPLNATIATTIDLGVPPVALGLNPATQLFYVSLANGNLGVIDVATNVLVSASFFCCPALNSPLGLTVDSTTSRLYVAENVSSGQVVVIDTASMSAGTNNGLLARVPVGAAPVHLVADSETHKVYVNNSGGNSISVIQDLGLERTSCGDASGPGAGDVPCRCGDTVTTDTVLDNSDPVVSSTCPQVGLFVAPDVTLDASSTVIRCDSTSGPTTGIWIVGDGVVIHGGAIHGCQNGLFGFTSGSTVERVTASEGGAGIFITGDGNRLLRNRCEGNGLDGIFLSGSSNALEKNSGLRNGGNGVAVVGSSNQLLHNQGRTNGGQGVVAVGGGNISDLRNHAIGNAVKPECSIDGLPPATKNGKHCGIRRGGVRRATGPPAARGPRRTRAAAARACHPSRAAARRSPSAGNGAGAAGRHGRGSSAFFSCGRTRARS
jgi:DNA-binding beta-propeller fold protein YncE